jgi:hypothetical protein
VKSPEEIQENLDRVFQNILFQREDILNDTDWNDKQQRETVFKCLFMEGVNNGIMEVMEPLSKLSKLKGKLDGQGRAGK